MTDMNEDLLTYIIKNLCRSTCAMESINMVADENLFNYYPLYQHL